MHKLRLEFEKSHLQLQERYESKLQNLKEDLELRRKVRVCVCV